MVAIKSGEVDAFLRRISTIQNTKSPAFVFLIYGPDVGLVNERATGLARALIDNPDDPFQLIKMDGDTIASDPARLIDEANTISLFGARRTLWVRTGSKSIAPAVENVIKADNLGSSIVIEAGDLKTSAPLRSLCEKAKNAYAIPCYADNERDIAVLLDETLKQEGLSINRDARALVLENLGGDRLATRGEIAKLVLYAKHPNDITHNEISLTDVEAILADVSSLITDAVIDAAFSGQMRNLELDTQRLSAEGIHGSVVLGAALRHAFQLLALRLDIETGTPQIKALESWRGLHFKRKTAITQQLVRFNAITLKKVVQNLQNALLETRRQASLTNIITFRALLQISVIKTR